MKLNGINSNTSSFKAKINYNTVAKTLLKDVEKPHAKMSKNEAQVVKTFIKDLDNDLSQIAKGAPEKDVIDISVSYEPQGKRPGIGLNSNIGEWNSPIASLRVSHEYKQAGQEDHITSGFNSLLFKDTKLLGLANDTKEQITGSIKSAVEFVKNISK